MATLKYLRTTPDLAAHDHSWFIVTETMLAKEFALSGSEQNADITNRNLLGALRSRLGKGAPREVASFRDKGADFVVADDLETLVGKMNGLTEQPC